MSVSPKYILTERIAQGGMAEIHLGKSVGLDGFARICAFKRILPQYAQDSEFIQMFRNEAAVVKQLQNKNIVQVFDFVSDGSSYMLVMEFVDGQDLRALLATVEQQRKKIPIEIACFIVLEILSGLSYAHNAMDVSGKSMGIIHRDVSPQNVLISYEGDTKITDFGIAKVQNSANKTRAGVLKGKFRYMSPEQAMGQTIDARSDIFAVGVIIWEMLTMQRLFKGEDMAVLESVRACKVKLPSSVLKTPIPPELESIVMKMLARDPGKRYQTAKDAIRDLSKFLYQFKPEFFPGEIAEFMNSVFREKIVAARERLRSTLALPVGGLGVAGGSGDVKEDLGLGGSRAPEAIDVSQPGQKAQRLSANAPAVAGAGGAGPQRAAAVNKSLEQGPARQSAEGAVRRGEPQVRPSQAQDNKNLPASRNVPRALDNAVVQAGQRNEAPRPPRKRRRGLGLPAYEGDGESATDPLLIVILVLSIALFVAAIFQVKRKGALRTTYLQLSVSPPDSSLLKVQLNGEKWRNLGKKQGPFTLELGNKREDVLEIRRDGYKNKTVTLMKPLFGGTLKQVVTLEKDSIPRVSVKIETVPKGAVVEIKGENLSQRQKSPAVFARLAAGSEYRLSIRHPKCQSVVQDVLAVKEGVQRANLIVKTYRLGNCK